MQKSIREGESVFVGIDVSRRQLEVALWPERQSKRFDNTKSGHEQLLSWLQGRAVAGIVLEASGGYERQLVAALQGQGLPVRVENPRRTRHFAIALGVLAKTDGVDAGVLAQYADKLRPPSRVRVPCSLRLLLDRRTQLLRLQTAESNRLQQSEDANILASIENLLSVLAQQIELINEQILQGIAQDPVRSRRDRLLQSVPSVGWRTSAALQAHLPELGRLNRRCISALAGVAPYDRQSGQWTGKACIWGGRAAVRSALYMACISGVRHNPALKTMYDRLCRAGKPKKVALTACMRKLLIILNAILASGEPWRQEMTENA